MATTIDPMELEHSIGALQGVGFLIAQAIDCAGDPALESLLRDASRAVEGEIEDLGALADRLAPARPRRSRIHPEDRRWLEAVTAVLTK